MKRVDTLRVGGVYWTRGKKERVKITGTDKRGWYCDESGRWWTSTGERSVLSPKQDLIWYDPAESLHGIWSGLTKAQAKVVMEARA